MKNRLFILIVTFVAMACNTSNKESVEGKMISYEENLADMKIKTAQLIAHIRQYKVEETDELRLSAFFYTNKKENMERLASELQKMEYPVNAGEYSKDKPFIVNAKSPYIKMSEESIQLWVEEMCALSNKHNCVMEGWSVDPKQPRKQIYQ
jgi:methyl coenzyme M reductase subunit D